VIYFEDCRAINGSRKKKGGWNSEITD
jgi:hypothetical protein